jgi:hypothetical protein
LTLCCGLEVQNITKTFQRDKDPGNTFHLNRKWENNFSVGNFKGDINVDFFEKFPMKLDPIPPHPGNLYTFA